MTAFRTTITITITIDHEGINDSLETAQTRAAVYVQAIRSLLGSILLKCDHFTLETRVD